VAKGEAEAYFRLNNINEWDICAMDSIVREASAKMTDLNGEEMTYNKEVTKVSKFLISNGVIHQELLALV